VTHGSQTLRPSMKPGLPAGTTTGGPLGDRSAAVAPRQRGPSDRPAAGGCIIV
jgi:hypothetical protein